MPAFGRLGLKPWQIACVGIGHPERTKPVNDGTEQFPVRKERKDCIAKFVRQSDEKGFRVDLPCRGLDPNQKCALPGAHDRRLNTWLRGLFVRGLCLKAHCR